MKRKCFTCAVEKDTLQMVEGSEDEHSGLLHANSVGERSGGSSAGEGSGAMSLRDPKRALLT